MLTHFHLSPALINYYAKSIYLAAYLSEAPSGFVLGGLNGALDKFIFALYLSFSDVSEGAPGGRTGVALRLPKNNA